MGKLFNTDFFAPILILLIGFGFLIYATPKLSTQYSLSKVGIETQGKVIEMREYSNSDHTAYVPVVEFTTLDGLKKTFVSSNASQPPEYKVGDLVTIIYDPKNQNLVQIKNFDLILQALFVIIGAIITVLGLVDFLHVLRRSELPPV